MDSFRCISEELSLNFFRGSIPLDPPSCFMLTCSLTLKSSGWVCFRTVTLNLNLTNFNCILQTVTIKSSTLSYIPDSLFSRNSVTITVPCHAKRKFCTLTTKTKNLVWSKFFKQYCSVKFWKIIPFFKTKTL